MGAGAFPTYMGEHSILLQITKHSHQLALLFKFNWELQYANTDVIYCFQFYAEQQLQFFEIFLACNAACITYSLQFEFSGYYSHDQPAQWLLFTTNRAQYGVDQLTFGQQIFFRGDKSIFKRRFSMQNGRSNSYKQMVIVSDENF